MTLLDRSARAALGRLTNQGDDMTDPTQFPELWWSPSWQANGYSGTDGLIHVTPIEAYRQWHGDWQPIRKVPADAVRLVAAAVQEADVDDDCRSCGGSQYLCSGLVERESEPCCPDCDHGAAVPEAAAGEPIDELIERSSLGTPEAKALRSRISDDQVRRVLDRVAELDRRRAGGLSSARAAAAGSSAAPDTGPRECGRLVYATRHEPPFGWADPWRCRMNLDHRGDCDARRAETSRPNLGDLTCPPS